LNGYNLGSGATNSIGIKWPGFSAYSLAAVEMAIGIVLP